MNAEDLFDDLYVLLDYRTKRDQESGFLKEYRKELSEFKQKIAVLVSERDALEAKLDAIYNLYPETRGVKP